MQQKYKPNQSSLGKFGGLALHVLCKYSLNYDDCDTYMQKQ